MPLLFLIAQVTDFSQALEMTHYSEVPWKSMPLRQPRP